jgi:sodium/bile acid cotransporter 7
VAGQLLRRWIGGWVAERRAMLSQVDRGSILLVVYTAFSGAVVGGVWSRSARSTSSGCLILARSCWPPSSPPPGRARSLRFATPDEIAIVFCGSKKSLASGAPMAAALLPGGDRGPRAPAADDVPPDPADGLRGDRPALRKAAD